MSKTKQFNSSNTKMLTRGGQITLNNLRMLIQVNMAIMQWSLGLLLVVCAISIYIRTPSEVVHAAMYYYLAQMLNLVWLGHTVLHYTYGDQVMSISANVLPYEHYFFDAKSIFFSDLMSGFVIGVIVSSIFMMVVTAWLIRRGREQAKKRFVRGSQIAKPQELAKAIRLKGASDIVIGEVPMIKDFEVQHTLIHGTIGTGKSVTIMEMIDHIRARGDSAIIFDKGCSYIRTYYNEKSDTILNPFDKRCAAWDLWAECQSESDFQNIAESLIPMEAQSSDPYWTNAARTVFSCTAYKLKGDADRSLKKLHNLLITASLPDLSNYLKDTAAATLVSETIEKTAISIRSVLTTYLKCLNFMSEVPKGESFSIKDWLEENAKPSSESKFCFISSMGEQHASIRPLISMWLSMASINLLSLEPNPERRIWVIIDELPTLHKLPQLGETIAEVRKFGGCFVLGMQSLSQLQNIYGRDGAGEIFDLLNTRFYFRSPSSEMARLVSNELGHQEIEQSNENYSYGSNTMRDGISIGTHTQKRELVSEAEIMGLDNLLCYLRVPANLPCSLLRIAYKHRESLCAGFMQAKPTLELIPKKPAETNERNEKNQNNEKKVTNDNVPLAGKTSEDKTSSDTSEKASTVKLKEENEKPISSSTVPAIHLLENKGIMTNESSESQITSDQNQRTQLDTVVSEKFSLLAKLQESDE
jgi:type IV conjugative transfer system coupling protein TraD